MTQEHAFRYTALDRSGKRCAGTLEAGSEHAAYRDLASRGLTPVKLMPVRPAGVKRRRKVSSEDVAALTRELSVLVEARIPIARGLVSVAENESNPALAEMVRDIASRIESGEKITEAFGRYRHVFGDVYIETLRAAEESGTLDSITAHLAVMLERGLETRKQLKRALSYPAIVITFVAIAMTVIVVFVVPKFAVIFETNGVALPITTRVVQAVGNAVTTRWYAFLGGLAAAVVALVMGWKSPVWRARFEVLFLRIPCLGPMLVAMTAARFSRVLGIAIGAGLDLTESIVMAGRATGRPIFVAETQRMAERMRGGASLPDVMRQSRYLPSFARRMLAAGKDSRELASASGIIASHYDRESDHLARSVNTLIEPIMTIALACIVMLVALSVFLPMWQMIKINHG